MWKKVRPYLCVLALGIVLGAAACYFAGAAANRELQRSLDAANTDAAAARSALAATIHDIRLAQRDNERLGELNRREHELGLERARLLAVEREYNRRTTAELERLVDSTGRSLERVRTAAGLVELIDGICHELYGIYGSPPG